MSKYLVFLFIFYTSGLLSQELNDKLVTASFKDVPEKKPSAKKTLAFKNKAAYFNPLSYVGAGLMYVYQNLISEQIQADCTYEISCSEFTRRSIQKYGFVAGTLKGFNQLSECIAGARYEHPHIFLNSNHKIINTVEAKDK